MKKQCGGRCVEITVTKGEITDSAFLGYVSQGVTGLCACSVRDDAKHSVISYISPNDGFFASRSLSLADGQFRVLCRQLSFVMEEMVSAGFDCRGMMLEKDCVFFNGSDFIFIVLPLSVIKAGRIGKDLSSFLLSCSADKKNTKSFGKALKECKTAEECIQRLNEFADKPEMPAPASVSSGFIMTGQRSFSGFPSSSGGEDTVLLNSKETEAVPIHSEFYSGDTTVLSRQGADDDGSGKFYSGDTTLLNNSGSAPQNNPVQVPNTQNAGINERIAGSERPVPNHRSQSPPRRSIYLIRANTGDVYEINSELFTIGSDSQRVTCFIDNPSVSHVHACIMYRNGNYHLADNDSTNGTSLDGVTLGRGESRELYDGAIISFGTEPFQIAYGG